MNDQRYTKRWDLKRKVHGVKLKRGVFSALLIAGFFIGLYLGLVKTNQGWDSNGMHSNYLLQPQALDIQGDGSKELMACTGREKYLYNDANQAKGTNDLGRVIIFDPANGEIIWNYTHPEQNFVVNLIGVPNLKAGNPSIGEYILVQFAHVAASETERNDGNRIRVTRNETGYYETLLLDTLDPVSPVILNLTNEIQGRIVEFIPLKQAGNVEAFPDFVISCYNVTLEEEINHDYGNPLISVSAYYGNGSLAWEANNTQADAIINSSTICRPLDFDGTRINNTHYAIKSPDNKVVIFHLETGAVSNRISIAPGQELEFLIDFFTDVSGDGVIDIC
ncbi:hypothetical protein GF325_09705, partial [Candidatus Bathyarchaeota archaeon]|nr:hypothetical protein [Candidatus Bathyarchaeota archaeon]